MFPDERLIQRYSRTYSLEPKLLTDVLSKFGRLPIGGQEQLIRCLVRAFGQYQSLAKSVGKIPPSEIRDQLIAIESTTERLLLHLGVNPNKVSGYKFWDASERLQRLRAQGRLYLVDQLSVVGIETTGKDVSAVNAVSQEAGRRVMDTVFGLLDLHERAKKAVQTAIKRTAPGKGGLRRRPDAEGQLIRDAIAIYEHMRGQYPESGAKPGYVIFIHAVAALFGTCVRGADIRKAWSTHTRKSKLK
jgi:hypothetical protein